MKKITERIICNRCKEEITNVRIRLEPEYLGMYPRQEEILMSLRVLKICGKDFCEECAKDIIDFALNKDACDECIRDMEDNAALLRAADEETEASPNMEKYKAVMSTYLGEPVKRDKCATDENGESSSQKEPDPNEKFYGIDLSVGSDRTINTCLILKEKMAEMLKSIYKNAQWIDGKYVIPLQPVAPELIDNYQSKFKGRQ